jgi:hypothetical protein
MVCTLTACVVSLVAAMAKAHFKWPSIRTSSMLPRIFGASEHHNDALSRPKISAACYAHLEIHQGHATF